MILYNPSLIDTVKLKDIGVQVLPLSSVSFTNNIRRRRLSNSDDALIALATGKLLLENTSSPQTFYDTGTAMRKVSLTPVLLEIDNAGKQAINISPKPNRIKAVTYITGASDDIVNSKNTSSYNNSAQVGYSYNPVTGIVTYNSNVDLSKVQRLHEFNDGANRRFDVLMVNDSNNTLALDKGLSINESVSNGSHGSIFYCTQGNGQPFHLSLGATDYRITLRCNWRENLDKNWKNFLHDATIWWYGAPRGAFFEASVYADSTGLQTTNNKNYIIDPQNRLKEVNPGTGTHGLTNTGPVYVKVVDTVPEDGFGYFNVNPETGAPVFKADGTGNYNLFSIRKKVVTFCNRLWIEGTDKAVELGSKDIDYLPGRYYLEFQVYNSDGLNGNDPPKIFHVDVWIKMFRGDTLR